MTPQAVIASLDAQLREKGEDIILVRSGSPGVTVRAKVRALGSDRLRPGANGAQGNFRAILSPTSVAGSMFEAQIRTGDKLTRVGQQRAITYVSPVQMGGVVVRIEIDFVG